MKVIFVHLGSDLSLVNIMLASVRRVMSCPILHITDSRTPKIDGCERMEHDGDFANMSLYRLQALAKVPGEWVVLDTDVIVQADLSHVFACAFDVGLTRRNAPSFLNGQDLSIEQPYNAGVRFSRCQQFWRDAADRCKGLPNAWFGEQQAAADIVRRGTYDVLELPGTYYNHTPTAEEEDVEHCKVVHYKGQKRKDWMRRKWQTT